MMYKIIKILAVLVLAGASVNAETVIGTWNIKIRPSSDGQKVLLTIQTTGTVYFPFVESRMTPGGLGIGYAGMPSQPASTPAWNMPDASFSISPIGYITNSTIGFSRELNQISFGTQPPESQAPGANVFFLNWMPFEPWLHVYPGDVVTFNLFSNPSEFEVGLAYSNFNEGVYLYGGAQQNILEIVPEPSSLSLLLAGGAVLMAGRRRKV